MVSKTQSHAATTSYPFLVILNRICFKSQSISLAFIMSPKAAHPHGRKSGKIMAHHNTKETRKKKENVLQYIVCILANWNRGHIYYHWFEL